MSNKNNTSLKGKNCLSALFLESCVPEVRKKFSQAKGLEELIRGILRRCKETWPEIENDHHVFIEHLGRCLLPGDTLDSLHFTDIYFAVACLKQQNEALNILINTMLPRALCALRHFHRGDSMKEDVGQMLLTSLLLSDNHRHPGLAKYSGKGSLSAYLRSAVVYTATKLTSRSRKEMPLPEAFMDELSHSHDAEYAVIKKKYGEELRAALSEALDLLSPRERNLLRLYLGGMSVFRMSNIYKVHRVTMSRQLLSIREGILENTRNALIERLKISRHELDSLILLIRSRIYYDIERHINNISDG